MRFSTEPVMSDRTVDRPSRFSDGTKATICASRAAIRSIRGPLAPIIKGGCGRCVGRGRTMASRTR